MRTPDRYVLARAGILNLYEYDDQVFEPADGRLLLRGHNTSGKTKALELLLPFCLDGDISPRKLDPFARSAKEMKWNLLGRVERDQQIGYVSSCAGRTCRSRSTTGRSRGCCRPACRRSTTSSCAALARASSSSTSSR